MTVETTPVDSSNVSAVAYNDRSRTLTLTFKDGASYEYYDVPVSVGNSFPWLESKGKAVWSLLRGTYAYKRL